MSEAPGRRTCNLGEGLRPAPSPAGPAQGYAGCEPPLPFVRSHSAAGGGARRRFQPVPAGSSSPWERWRLAQRATAHARPAPTARARQRTWRWGRGRCALGRGRLVRTSCFSLSVGLSSVLGLPTPFMFRPGGLSPLSCPWSLPAYCLKVIQ